MIAWSSSRWASGEKEMRGLLRTLFCVAVSAIFLVSGCGKGSLEFELDGPPNSVFFVSSATPAPGDNGVATDPAIIVTFSAPLAASGIDADEITLRRTDGEPIPVAVSYDGQTVTLTPAVELSLLTRYTVTVAAGIESNDVGVLERDYVWEFTTRDGSWSERDIVGTHVFDPGETIVVGDLSIGVDPDGDALAVWTIRDFTVLGAAYRHDVGWSNVQVLNDFSGLWTGVRRRAAKVHEMGSGELWVSWREEERPLCGGAADGLFPAPCPEAYSTPEIIVVSHYSRSTGWGVPEMVGGIENREILSHDIVSDASGRAILVWHQRGGGADTHRVRAVHYAPDSGWGEVQELSGGFGGWLAGIFRPPLAAMDASGQAAAVWSRLGSSNEASLWAVRYEETAGWGEPRQISIGNGHVTDTALAMDGNGNALFAWEQEDPAISGSRVIWAGSDGQGQVRIQQMSSNVIWALGPQLASDANGHALLTFTGDGGAGVFGARYEANSGWSQATQIGTAGVSSEGVALSMNESGRGLAVWSQEETGVGWNVWAATYDPESGWGGAERVSSLVGKGFPLAPLPPAMDEYGNALAIWVDMSGVTTWSARYRREGSWGVPERLGGTETFPYATVTGPGGRALVTAQSSIFMEDTGAAEIQMNVFRFE